MQTQHSLLFEVPLAHEATYYTNPELELEWEMHEGSHCNAAIEAGEWEQQGQQCPTTQPIRITISRFPVHQNAVATLPKSERDKIDQIANMVIQSFRPGCTPIRWIMMVGHADTDTPRRPSFEKVISGERVSEVQKALNIAINARRPGLTRQVALVMRRKGASELLGTDRAMNRRVAIYMVPGQPPPPAPPPVILGQVVQRGLGLLKTRPIPDDRTGNRTKRMQCVLSMVLKPGVEDGYFNGFDWQIRSNANMGRLTPAQLASFLSRVRSDLTKPWMGSSASDEDLLAELERLDARIWFGISNINRHIEVNGTAADIARKQMKSFISQQQQNRNSIYSCYGAGQ